MKILSLNLDHTNTNYDNCVKRGIITAIKEDADIMAFHEVKFGTYGYIKDSQYVKSNYNYELDDRVKLLKPYGHILLTRFKIKDFEYDESTQSTIYFTKDTNYIITHDLNDSVLNIVKSYTLPNGNQKSTVVICSENIYHFDIHGMKNIENVRKNVETSKYPMIFNSEY